MIQISKYTRFILIAFIASCSFSSFSMENDSLQQKNWNIHYQTTIINQYHPYITAPYSGDNSLSPAAEDHTSISSTLFLGFRLWKSAELYLNAELSGGEGFSATKGIAGFTNGEVYRVDSPTPKIFPARYYLKQIFPFSEKMVQVQDKINQIATLYPEKYLALYLGKFSMLDFFDANQYSHDPRTQFYNWALMGNGAWDYPADTRGYTNGTVLEYIQPGSALRFGAVMVATQRNGAIFDTNLSQSYSLALEYEKNYSFSFGNGVVRLLGFLTSAQMGNYKQAIAWGEANNTAPNLDVYHANGRKKLGVGVNIEHSFSEYIGGFLRASVNDGRNETWAFTEIDRHISLGLSFKGSLWDRPDDRIGFAQLVNGLSADHRNYLAKGGYGFIIGDGQLNYAPETISEFYYSFKIPGQPIWLAPDYQFVINPGYNMDRGPVHAFGVRLHLEI